MPYINCLIAALLVSKRLTLKQISGYMYSYLVKHIKEEMTMAEDEIQF